MTPRPAGPRVGDPIKPTSYGAGVTQAIEPAGVGAASLSLDTVDVPLRFFEAMLEQATLQTQALEAIADLFERLVLLEEDRGP